MLNALTSFRFIAALFVFIWHIRMWLPKGIMDNVQLGYVGVGFFFSLSGFILTYVYFKKLSAPRVGDVKKFYISRIAKIYPLHILTFLASIPLVLGSAKILFPTDTKINLISAALFNIPLFQAWVPDNIFNFSFNGVSWSISVELFFYALFPLIILGFAALNKKYNLLKNTKILVCILALMWVVQVSIYSTQIAYMDGWLFYIFPLLRLPDFVMGILLGLIFISTKDGRSLKLKNTTGIEVFSLLALAFGIALSFWMPQSLKFSVWLAPFWALIIFVFALEKGRISKALSSRVMVFLGEISFSFYMVHQLIIRYVLKIHLEPIAGIAISLLLSIFISGILYTLYEEPVRIKLKNYLESKIINKKKNAKAKKRFFATLLVKANK